MRRVVSQLGAVLVGAALALGFGSCSRANVDYCAPDTPCPKDRRCVPAPNLDTGEGTCVPIIDLGGAACQSSLTCDATAPLCDDTLQVCRTCRAGEDGLCDARSQGDTPRCDGGRCVQCALPAGATKPQQVTECTKRGAPRLGQAPVCQDNVCRPCQRHDECSSGVCIKDESAEIYGLARGSCVPVSQVLAVSSTACSPTGPVYCRPADAIKRLGQQVENTVRYRYLVFKSGGIDADFSEIQLGLEQAQSGLDLHLIAAPSADDPVTQMDPARAVHIVGSTNPARRGFVVSGNVRVTLEGFFIHDASIGVDCSGAAAVDTQVRVLRSWLTSNSTALSASSKCVLKVEDSWVGARANVKQGSLGNNGPVAVINRADFQFSNTVFANNGNDGLMPEAGFGGVKIFGTLGGSQTSRIVNSIFYQNKVTLTKNMPLQRASAIWCDRTIDKPLVVLNTLFLQGDFYRADASAITTDCGEAQNGVLVSGVLADDADSNRRAGYQPDQRATREDLFTMAQGSALDFTPRGAPQSDKQQRHQSGGQASVPVTMADGSVLTIPAPERDLNGVARPKTGKVAIGPLEPQP